MPPVVVTAGSTPVFQVPRVGATSVRTDAARLLQAARPGLLFRCSPVFARSLRVHTHRECGQVDKGRLGLQLTISFSYPNLSKNGPTTVCMAPAVLLYSLGPRSVPLLLGGEVHATRVPLGVICGAFSSESPRQGEGAEGCLVLGEYSFFDSPTSPSDASLLCPLVGPGAVPRSAAFSVMLAISSSPRSFCNFLSGSAHSSLVSCGPSRASFPVPLLELVPWFAC